MAEGLVDVEKGVIDMGVMVIEWEVKVGVRAAMGHQEAAGFARAQAGHDSGV